MGSTGDFLFGSTTSPTTSALSTKSGGQEDLLAQLTKLLGGQLGQGVPSYQGSLTADPSELQTKTWGQVSSLLDKEQSPFSNEAIAKILQGTTNVPGAVQVQGFTPKGFDSGEVQGLFNQGLGNAADTFDPEQVKSWFQGDFGFTPQAFDPSKMTGTYNQAMGNSAQTFNPDLVSSWYERGEFDPNAAQNWWKDAMVNPAMKTWEQDVVPNIQEKFIGQNAGSSGAANRAIARSAEDMMSGLNSQLANTLFGEKQAWDTRDFQNQQALASALLGEKGAADTRGFSSAQNLAQSLLGEQSATNARTDQAGENETARNFQAIMNQAQALQGEKGAADTRGFTAAQGLINSLMGEYGNANTREYNAGMDTTNKQFTADTDFMNRLFNAGQADLTRTTQVPSMENTGLQQLLDTLKIGGETGAAQRGIEQQGLQEDYSKWLYSQGYNNPYLQMLGATMGVSPVENLVNPGSQQQGLMQSVIAPLASAYMGSGSTAVSDWLTNLFKSNPNTPASGTATGAGSSNAAGNESGGGVMDTITNTPTSLLKQGYNYLSDLISPAYATEYGSPGFTNSYYPATQVSSAALPAAATAEYGSPGFVNSFYPATTSTPTSSAAAGGLGALGATAAEVGTELGALTAAEAAGYGGIGAGAGAGASASFGSSLGATLGPIGVVLAPLLTGLSQRKKEKASKEAFTQYWNSLTPEQRKALNDDTYARMSWQDAWNSVGGPLQSNEAQAYDSSLRNYPQQPDWLQPNMEFNSPGALSGIEEILKALSDQGNWGPSNKWDFAFTLGNR